MAIHPIITSPTKVPTKSLPVTPLPNGLMEAPVTSSGTIGGPASTNTELSGLLSSIGTGTIFYSIIGIGILVLASMAWFLSSRKNDFIETKTPNL